MEQKMSREGHGQEEARPAAREDALGQIPWAELGELSTAYAVVSQTTEAS